MRRSLEEAIPICLACLCWAVVVCVAGCDSAADQQSKMESEASGRERARLLSFAFDAATAIPLDPHRKDRAKTQEAVVNACMEVDQHARAAEYARRIENWRRGAAMARLSFHMARTGDTELAERYLQDALRVAAHVKDWRKERVRTHIARAQALLGRIREAEALTRNVDMSERGRLTGIKPVADDADFRQRIESAKQAMSKGDFDLTRNTLFSLGELYAMEYDDRGRREELAELIRASLRKLPVFVRIDILSGLADSAIELKDKRAARAFMRQAREIAYSARWSPISTGIETKGRIAKRLALAGDHSQAKSDVEDLLREYTDKRDRISTMDRADALIPLAESMKVLGNHQESLALYAKAVRDGSENANARVRATDLSAIACSMAVMGVLPDRDLWARMETVRQGLKAPW